MLVKIIIFVEFHLKKVKDSMIVSQGKYVLQRKWAYMSRVSINYLRVKKVIEAFCTRKDKAKIKSMSR
ncbi:hypothetical protein HMPREF2532_01358 [Bacteroides ovatus]|nr:hypothetical protein HMPREF2532_01358 [Bacteroides ovatus]